MNFLIFSLIQTVLVIALAPLMIGMIRMAKARFQNRRGASVFQPYWALLTLCRKEMTITTQSSWVFRVVPFVVLTTSIVLAILMPTLGFGGFFAQASSVFLIGAILAIGSLFLVFGGLDVASAFGGMGSSREMTLAALVEPSTVLTLVTLALAAGSWNLDGIFASFAHTPWYASHPLLILTFLALGCVILSEGARYPVDNPATHLELTMVHEAMILEYSGPYLAMLEMASAIKLTVLALFLMGLVFPWGVVASGAGIGAMAIGILAMIVKLFVAAFAVAFIESTLVKMRFYRMQEYMTTAYFLGLAGLVLSLLF